MDEQFAFRSSGFRVCITQQQNNTKKYELSQRGIHWDAIDEDISVDGLLAGHGDLTHSLKAAA